MGNIVQLIFDKLFEFWPVRIIDAGCQGVRYDPNGKAVCLAPGWHLILPKLQRVEEVNVQYQNADCGLQSLTTKDGVEITLSLNLGYSITDAALLWTSYQHFDTSFVNDARGHAAAIVAESTYQELLTDVLGFGQEILEAIAEDVEPDGVKVETVTADQFSKARPYRLLGQSPF